MRVLLIYASRYGQTEKVCEHIAHILRIHGSDATALPIGELPRALRLEAFHTVVLAGPVYFGKHLATLEQFARTHRGALSKITSVFVSVSGAASDHREEAQKTAQEFLDRTQWKPDRVELVAGGEPYTRYGFFTRWMMVWKMRKLGRKVDPNRDYEFTDWAAVAQFARELAGHTEDVRKPAPACRSDSIRACSS